MVFKWKSVLGKKASCQLTITCIIIIIIIIIMIIIIIIIIVIIIIIIIMIVDYWASRAGLGSVCVNKSRDFQ